MSLIGGIGGLSPEQVQKVGQQALDNVSTGIDVASKAGVKIQDSLQIYNQLAEIGGPAGGADPQDLDGLLLPAVYLNEAGKYGAVDPNLLLYLNDPQFDLNAPLVDLKASGDWILNQDLQNAVLQVKPEILQVDPDLLQIKPEVLAVKPEILQIDPEVFQVAQPATEKSTDQMLVDKYQESQDKMNDLIEEFTSLDLSTEEGQKRYFEIQQEFQKLTEMMNLITSLLKQLHDLRMSIIQNI